MAEGVPGADGDVDLVVLEVAVPAGQQHELARRLRHGERDVAVVVLPHVGAPEHGVPARLVALRPGRTLGGADPTVAPDHHVLRHGDLVVDPSRRVATRAGARLDLTRREFELLEVLVRNADLVLSRAQLLREVWGVDTSVRSNVVDVFVGYLRRKLEAGGRPRSVHTVRGVGFVLRAEG